MINLVEGHNRKIFHGGYLLQVIVVHGLCLWCLLAQFDWFLAISSTLIALSMAYAMGIFHHMQLTHNSFQSHRLVTYIGVLWGTLSWRGPFAPPLKYVAGHTVHHAYADTEFDPHTPTDGLFHAFMGWFWKLPFGLYKREHYLNYVPKRLLDDNVLRWMDKNCNFIQFVWALLAFALGGWIYVGYFVGVKTVVVLWGANAVDVINHTHGYRNFETADQSTNSFVMAAIHLGGAISWHNNHHAEPDYFTVKMNWWEIDAHYSFLKILEKLGLASNIKKKVYLKNDLEVL